MKTLITLILSIISIPLFSQSKGIRCIYSSSMEVSKGVYEMENEIAKKMVIRDIQEDKKIYSLTAVGNKYLFTKEPESVDKVPLMVDKKNIYVDLDDSIKVTQSEFVNKLYIVKGHANRLDWDVEEKTAIRQRSGKTRASRRGLRPKFLLRAPLSDITDCPDLW